MIHSKKLAQLARKCQRMAVAGGAGGRRQADFDECCSTASSSSTVADKGHCVVYAADGARFEVPLAYLGTTVFGELLRMSRDEFGFASGGDGGRITLPCDSSVVEYVMCLVRREASEEVENAFLSSIVGSCHCHDASSVAPSSMVALFGTEHRRKWEETLGLKFVAGTSVEGEKMSMDGRRREQWDALHRNLLMCPQSLSPRFPLASASVVVSSISSAFR